MPVQARCERGTRKNNACALPQRNAVAREPVPNNSMQPEQSSSGQREEGGGWARGVPVEAAHLQRGRAGGARSEGKHERRPHGKRAAERAGGERRTQELLACAYCMCEMNSYSSRGGTETALFFERGYRNGRPRAGSGQNTCRKTVRYTKKVKKSHETAERAGP